jgi:hypothetical protein
LFSFVLYKSFDKDVTQINLRLNIFYLSMIQNSK